MADLPQPLPVQPGQPAEATRQIALARATRAVMHPEFAGLDPAEKIKIADEIPDEMPRKAVRALANPAFSQLDAREKLKIVRLLPGFTGLNPMEQAQYFQRVAFPSRSQPPPFSGIAEQVATAIGDKPNQLQQEALEVVEGAVKIPAAIGKTVLKVASLPVLRSVGIPTEKVLQPAGQVFEKAADAARSLLPPSWANPDSTSTLVNFMKMLPDFGTDVAGKWISENIQALDSVGGLVSIGLTPGAAAAVRQGARLALAGNVAQGARVIGAAVAEAAASPLQTGKAVAKGVGELATGIPARSLPETLGSAVAGPAGEAALRVAGRAGERVMLPTSIAQPLRRYAAPVNFQQQIPRAPASITTVAKELLAPIGSTLPEVLQPARRVLLAESEQGLKTAVDRMTEIAKRNLKPEVRAAASQIVEAQLASRELMAAGARRAEALVKEEKALAARLEDMSARLARAGVPPSQVRQAVATATAAGRAKIAKVVAQADAASRKASVAGTAVSARIARQFPEAKALALEIVQNTNALGRELIAAGYPREVFQRFKDAYLGRYYLSKELPTETTQALAQALGNGRVPAGGITVQDAARLMERGDLPQKVRDQLMEITDAGYREVRTIAQEKSLAAFGRFQQKVIKAGVVAKKAAPGLVQLADTPRMIRGLKGQFVPFDVARELALFDGVVLEYASPNFAKKAMSLWKEVVTVDNPAVWTGNVITNMAILDMMRIGPASLVGAARDLVRGSPEVAQARRLGLFDEAGQHRTAIRGELARFIAEDIQAGTIQGMAIQHASTMHRPAWQKWLGARRENVQTFYRAQDDIFKYTAFKDGLARGLKPDAALVRAREMFVDYSSLPIAIRRIGSSPISVMPFISWQYGIAPQLAKAISSNPMALQRWSNALDAWNAAAAMSVGESPDALERIKEARVQAFDTRAGRFFADNMLLMLMPVRSAAGDLMVTDVTRFNPYGTLLSGRAVTLSPAVLGFLELATGTRYYGTTPVGPIRSDEVISETARVLSIPPPVVAAIAKMGLAQAAKSTDPAIRDGAIRTLKLMFGTQGFGSPYGKPVPLAGQALGAAGIRVQPTTVPLERARAAQRIERRLEGEVGAREAGQVREMLFRKRLPPVPPKR